jgi:hypothetical protein
MWSDQQAISKRSASEPRANAESIAESIAQSMTERR